MKTVIVLFSCLFLLGFSPYRLHNGDKLGSKAKLAHTEQQHNYKAMPIGNQMWMAENLCVTTFKNGDPIAEAETKADWAKLNHDKKPAWCYYDGKAANGKLHGKLYNWYAVSDPRGLAPAGWEVPSEKDWQYMIKKLGGDEIAGRKLKSETGWDVSDKNPPGNNKSGLNIMPSGVRSWYGPFYDMGKVAKFWTSTSTKSGKASYFELGYYDINVAHGSINGDEGYSVRCIQN